MLLFFIAQMTAWADSCKAENLNTQEMNYTIYMCDYGFEKEVEAATAWWNNRGANIKLVDGVFNCNEDPRYAEIHIQFNNNEVKKFNTSISTAYAATIRTHISSKYGTVESSNIYLSTDLKNNKFKMKTFIFHEIGHAIGYEHVPESCNSYIMNPYINYMGSKL